MILDHNEIKEIPQRMCTMHSLKLLSLEDNKLTAVPYALCLISTLSELNLRDNQDLHDPPYHIVEDP